MKYYRVPANVLLDLINSSSFCDALEDAGVDCWEGYDNANEVWNELEEVPLCFEKIN